jgi:exonuclease 3'-5' domain-containing protein 1
VDPAVTAQLLGFLSQCVETKGPLLVDQLFHAVTSSCIPQDQWASMFKTPQDLSTFLKMHSDVFHVQANLVTLISAPTQTSPTRSYSKASNQTSANPQLCSLSHQNNSNNNNNVISLSSNVITLSNVNNNTDHQSGCPTPPAVALQNQTLKQRINSLVMKTIAHNTERDRSYAATSLANNTSTTSGAAGTDAWKAKILQNTKVIVSVKESLQVSETLFVVCDLRFTKRCCSQFMFSGI